MVENNLIIFTTLSLIILAWLSVVKECLSALTRGKIRKLDHKLSELEDLAEHWIDDRQTHLLLLDFLKTIFMVITTLLLSVLIHKSMDSLGYEVLIFIAISYLLIFVGKFFIYSLQGDRSWHVLQLSMPVVGILRQLFVPVLFPINMLAKRALTASAGYEGSVEDEILSLVEQDAHDEEGSGNSDLEEDERRMIQGILDLDNTPVKEIMTPRVDIIGVELQSGLEEVKLAIIESGHSRLPVYEDSLDNIIGLVYAKDLLNDEKVKNNDLKGILHKPPYIPESKNIGDLLEELRAQKRHISVVIDEYGGTSGLVTIEDILEEIVGEIQDEFDGNEITFEHKFNDDGSIFLEGRLNIDEFNKLLDADLDEDEGYETLAGFITDRIGRIPTVGEELALDAFIFIVVEADERRIVKLLIKSQDKVS